MTSNIFWKSINFRIVEKVFQIPLSHIFFIYYVAENNSQGNPEWLIYKEKKWINRFKNRSRFFWYIFITWGAFLIPSYRKEMWNLKEKAVNVFCLHWKTCCVFWIFAYKIRRSEKIFSQQLWSYLLTTFNKCLKNVFDFNSSWIFYVATVS